MTTQEGDSLFGRLLRKLRPKQDAKTPPPLGPKPETIEEFAKKHKLTIEEAERIQKEGLKMPPADK